MGRRGRAAAALALTMSVLLLISASGTGQVFAQSTRTTVDTNVMVAMRDGVRLATDIYRPDAPGMYPIILARTPYNKDGSKDDGTYFAQQGYVYVVQDTHGRATAFGWTSRAATSRTTTAT